MGYSVAVKFPTKGSRDTTLKFLKKNFREFGEVVDDAEFLSHRGKGGFMSEPIIDPCYSPKKLVIGFDYNAGAMGMEREYAWQMCYWVAQKLGIDHILYDREKVPMNTYREPRDIDLKRYEHYPDFDETKKEAEMIVKELERLDKLWLDNV